jgi:hypothetical protein
MEGIISLIRCKGINEGLSVLLSVFKGAILTANVT